MSDNHWETQPRKDNGEFTYRYEFWKQKLQAMEEMDFTNLIRKTGYKYAKAMLEKLEYDKKLYDEGVIYG